MRIGIVGAGKVGSTLGRRWADCGHDIVYGVRNPEDTKHEPLQDHAVVLSSEKAAKKADLVVLSVHWSAVRSAIDGIKDEIKGKILVDCTNPVGADLGAATSGAELIQTWAPGSNVVKAFNQIGFNIMANPVLDGRKTVLFIASDSKDSGAIVEGLATQLGFDVVIMPSLVHAHHLEALAMIWISMSYKLGYGREFAFSMIQRST